MDPDARTDASVYGRVSPAPEAVEVAPFHTGLIRSLPASWHELQFVRTKDDAWSYPIALRPPADDVWHVVHGVPVVDGCGKPAMPSCVVALDAGGRETAKPPTEIVGGAPPPAPSQLGAAAVPVPGSEWHELQSVVPIDEWS